MRAQALYEEALTLSREVGSKGTIASICHNLGHVAHHQGDRRRAAVLFQESLTLFRELGDQRGIAEALAGLGGVIGEEGQPEQAARLFGAVDATLEALGTTMWHSNLADYQRQLAAVRARLGDAAFAAMHAQGRCMPLGQVLDAALDG